MTEQQRIWLGQLSRCMFLPGSWDKRFVRDVSAYPADHELTDKQAAALHKLAYRYRRQRGDLKMRKPT